MKKIMLALAVAVLSVGMLSAQDLKSATEAYNAGAEMLGMGDKASALAKIQEALSIAEKLDDGAELVDKCKQAIPSVISSLAKELFNDKKYDEAFAKFAEAAEVAKKYGNEEVAADVAELLPQLGIQKDYNIASDAFDAKNFAAAAEGFKKVVDADTTNGVAALRLVQSLCNVNKLDAAKEALHFAVNGGQGDNAKKVLSNAFVKQASAALKAGKSADAVTAALASADILENANAFLIAGQASQKLAKTADAINYFSKYLDVAPTAKNAGAIALTVGALYQGQKNKAKAIEFYKKAQTLGQDTKAYIDALSK